MTLRRLIAVGILCFMALLTPALVRAADPASAPTGDAVAPQDSGATLALSPAAGFRSDKFSASYTDGQPCPQRAQAALIWDGQPIAIASHPQQSGKRCLAGFSNQLPPQGLNQPGDHVVQAELVTCSGPQSCAPVAGTDASAAYTIYAQETAPPTAPPVDPPVTAPPVPAATLPPAPTDTPTPRPTPMPTPLRIADPGTFAPYDCRNGIPDLTPCPSPVSAVAALVTGPADPAPPPATNTPAPAPADSAGLPMGTLALLAAVLGVLFVTVVVLGVRQGRAAHRLRRSSGGRGRRAGPAG